MSRFKASNFISIAIVLLQTVFAFVVTFILYMFLAIIDSDKGFDGMVTLAFFQPILGIILCSLVISTCLIAGLPIRIVGAINTWWVNHSIVPILGFLAGIISLMLSIIPAFHSHGIIEVDGMDHSRSFPNTFLSITGFLMVAFCALHIYPPKFIRDFVDKIARQLFS